MARLGAISSRAWKQTRWGDAKQGYPILSFERTSRASALTILLVGGIHGNEPAGVEAAIRWMEESRPEHDLFNWLIIPCANPTGWEHDRRTNLRHHDMNRHFNDPACCPECIAIHRALDGKRLAFSLDFHEDDEAPGFYICEIKKHPPIAGEQIVAAAAHILPVWQAEYLDGRRAISDGVVRRFPVTSAGLKRRKFWPLEFYLQHAHIDHTFARKRQPLFPWTSVWPPAMPP